ncbi:MAG TPA: hypothetical protein VK158_04790 [Acidobacteriota bacterium]|nr:hypothetical protein [Acidobacteriota bacterium]
MKQIILILFAALLLTACSQSPESFDALIAKQPQEYTITYDYSVLNYGSWRSTEYTAYQDGTNKKEQFAQSELFWINDTGVRCDYYDERAQCNLLGQGLRYIDPLMTAHFVQSLGGNFEYIGTKKIADRTCAAFEHTSNSSLQDIFTTPQAESTATICLDRKTGLLLSSEVKVANQLVASMTAKDILLTVNTSFEIPQNVFIDRRGCTNESIIFMVLPWKTTSATVTAWINDTHNTTNQTLGTMSFTQLIPKHITVPTNATKTQSQLCVGSDCSTLSDMSGGMCESEWFTYDQCFKHSDATSCQNDTACEYSFPYCGQFLCPDATNIQDCNIRLNWCAWDAVTNSCQYTAYPR